jgi:YggT family protein
MIMRIAFLAAGLIVTTWGGLVVLRWGIDLMARLRRLDGALKSRPAALLIEGLYVATDPAFKLLRRQVPAIRFGSVAFDLSYPLLLLLVSIVNAGLDRF